MLSCPLDEKIIWRRWLSRLTAMRIPWDFDWESYYVWRLLYSYLWFQTQYFQKTKSPPSVSLERLTPYRREVSRWRNQNVQETEQMHWQKITAFGVSLVPSGIMGFEESRNLCEYENVWDNTAKQQSLFHLPCPSLLLHLVILGSFGWVQCHGMLIRCSLASEHLSLVFLHFRVSHQLIDNTRWLVYSAGDTIHDWWTQW